MKKSIVSLRIIMIFLVGFINTLTLGQIWDLQHPGAGGQHQFVATDPNTEGRLYIAIDVNGVYRSDDYGDSWTHSYADAAHGFTFFIGVEPGDANRLYSGNFWGVDISNDAGRNWSTAPLPVPDSLNQNGGDSIAWINVDPSNTTRVFASPGWKSKDAEKRMVVDPSQSLTGERNLYVSTDRGVNWSSEIYESQTGYRQVYSMAVHPTNGKLYVGAHSGIYRRDGANNYTRLPLPLGAIDGLNDESTRRAGGGCRGIALSPDGRFLYALWAVEQYTDEHGNTNQLRTEPFMLNLSTMVWTPLGTADLLPAEWGYPKIDPRSSTTEHRLLLSTALDGPSHSQEVGGAKGRVGLFEGVFTFTSGVVDTVSWIKIGERDGLEGFSYEAGWENRGWKVRGAAYSPKNWSQRLIFASGGQNLYRTTTNGPGFPLSDWESIYSEKVGNHYTHRGYASTVSFDADAFSNYSIIGSADLGAFESFDGGQTWQELEINGQSGLSLVIVNQQNQTPTVFASFSAGFGASGEGGGLFYKKLNTFSESDTWVFLGGVALALQKKTARGGIHERGLPNLKYSDIAFDPATNALYIATKPGDPENSTIYMTEDVFMLVENPEMSFLPLRGLGNELIKNVSFSSLHLDPNNPDLLWIARSGFGGGLVLGEKTNSSDWAFSKIDLIDDKGNSSISDEWNTINDVSIFTHNAKTFIALVRPNDVLLSVDKGKNFVKVLDLSEVSPGVNPGWVNDPAPITFSGFIAGYKNRLYVGLSSNTFRRSGGFYEIELLDDGSGRSNVLNITGDKLMDGFWARASRATVVDNVAESGAFLLVPTRGSGMLRYTIGSSDGSAKGDSSFSLLKDELFPKGTDLLGDYYKTEKFGIIYYSEWPWIYSFLFSKWICVQVDSASIEQGFWIYCP